MKITRKNVEDMEQAFFDDGGVGFR